MVACSITHASGARMNMPKLHCANFATSSAGGKGQYRLIICQQDARLVFFHIFSLISPWLTALLQTAEIIALLYEATQDPNMPMEAPALNPTGGVRVKPPVMLDYKKDPTRPGGGVFVAAPGKSGEFKDIPEGVVISGSGSSNDGDQGAGGNDSEGEVASLVVAEAAQASSVSLPASNSSDRARNYFLSSPSPFFRMPSGMDYDRAGNGNAIMAPISAVRSPTDNAQQQQQSTPLVHFTPLTAGGGRGGNSGDGSDFMNVNPAMNKSTSGSGNVQVMNTLDAVQGGSMANLQAYATADGFLEGIPGGMFDWGELFPVFWFCSDLCPVDRTMGYVLLETEWKWTDWKSWIPATGEPSARRRVIYVPRYEASNFWFFRFSQKYEKGTIKECTSV